MVHLSSQLPGCMGVKVCVSFPFLFSSFTESKESVKIPGMGKRMKEEHSGAVPANTLTTFCKHQLY
jgi:hypothetical protein